MALPIPSKKITSALVKTGDDAKKENKKISSEKLFSGSTDKNKVKVSKFRSRQPKTYSEKFKTSKFLPPSKIEKQFDLKILDDILTSLVYNTKDLKNATKKDVDDENKKNIQKVNVKSKVKRNKREENVEEKKQVTKVSKPMKFKSPDFLTDILGMAGRFVLATGIMSILNYLTDPKKKDGLIQFLTDHIDKIVLGALAILGAVFVTSFLPVIGMVGTLLAILSPIIISLVGIVTNPAVLAVLGILAGGMALRTLLYKLKSPLKNFYTNQIQTRVNNYQYGDRAAEGQFIRALWDNYGRISTKEDRDKLTNKEKSTARFLKIYEEKLKEIATLKRSLRGARGPNNKKKQEDQIRAAEQVLDGIASQLEINGKSLSELQADYEKDGTLPQTSIQKGSPVVKPQPTQPTHQPQPRTFPTSTKGTRATSAVISSQMGYRNLPISPGYHMGVDITGLPLGSELLAFNDATINTVASGRGYGNYIGFVENKSRMAHFYGHMRQNMAHKFKVGQKVKAGTVLGTQGSSGRVTGEHLHWEASMNTDGTGMGKSKIRGFGMNAKEVGKNARFNPLSRYSIGTPFGFHKGGEVPGSGEIAAKLLGGEIVVRDESAGHTKDMLLAINQASGREEVMQAIGDYAPYEAIQSRMIHIPVEKMVPLLLGGGPGNGGGGFTGGSGGDVNRTDIILAMHYKEA
jgi:murein DD-endopeptidase MepM/ murein hydrolase activator NlpD